VSAPFDVTVYDDRWEDAQTRFAARNWPNKPRRGDPAYLRWEYRGPAHGPLDGLVLAVRDGEVIGQVGLLPGVVHVDGEDVPVQWIGNMMVDPSARRIGVSSAIFEDFMARPVLSLGTDPSASAGPMMSSVGFVHEPASDLMVLPLTLGPVVAARYPATARAGRLIDLAGVPAVRYLTRHLRRAQRSDLAQACSWRDVVDAVQATEAGLTAPHTVHDPAFLAWRCGGFPPWQREVDAVATPNGSFAIVERAVGRVLVLHWSAVDEHEAAAVLGRVAFLAEGYGASHVQAVANDDHERRWLEALGFRARRSPTELWWYPQDALGRTRTVLQGYDTDQNL
jgi:GNAT superfamily N-acetyltransferase